jgi:hypothetical protein
VYCGTLNIFQTDMTLRAARAEEVEALPASTQIELALARAVVNKFQREVPR